MSRDLHVGLIGLFLGAFLGIALCWLGGLTLTPLEVHWTIAAPYEVNHVSVRDGKIIVNDGEPYIYGNTFVGDPSLGICASGDSSPAVLGDGNTVVYHSH